MQPKISLTRQGSSDSMRSVDTPSTKLRKKYDVNSPKVRNKKITFNNAGQSADAPYPNFMTQVERPDPNNKQNEHTRHMQEADERHSDGEEDQYEQCPGCCNALFCGMFGAKPRNAPTRELKNADRQGNGDMGVNLDHLSRPQEDDQITATDDSGNEWDQDPPARNHRGGHQADVSSEEEEDGLLGPKPKRFKGKKCLVLDLDETLVHSSFKPVQDADFIVPVEIDGVVYKVYVLKRPDVDKFLLEAAKYYELVVFTASLSKYANPLLDILDTQNVIAHRLFRESCVLHGQAYVKDLSKLGRKLKDVIIVDNSPLSYAFHPTSAIPIQSWFDDRSDRQLSELLPVLKTTLRDIPDVRELLDANNKSYEWLCSQAKSSI